MTGPDSLLVAVAVAVTRRHMRDRESATDAVSGEEPGRVLLLYGSISFNFY